jgi:hypothetical protein
MEKEKFIVYHNASGSVDTPEKTRFEYEIDEIITVNNYENQYKCVSIENTDDKILYHFKQGIKQYTYDY